jgi:hypothetical protein
MPKNRHIQVSEPQHSDLNSGRPFGLPPVKRTVQLIGLRLVPTSLNPHIAQEPLLWGFANQLRREHPQEIGLLREELALDSGPFR